MFGWIRRCCGGLGVGSAFEKARIRSVIADWQVPDDDDLCLLISSFNGSNPDIQAKTAFNMFLSHLQTSEQKSNPLFLLKHLYIFDQAVEQGVILQSIATYYSSQFFIFKDGSNIEINPLRELVAAYFLYIKKKAEIYSQFEPKYYEMKKSEREAAISNLPFSRLFWLMDKCFDIQKGINEISSKYRSNNKSSDLIMMIFTMMLKTYLFCYTMVSLCNKVLFKRLKKFSQHELVQFYRFVRFYNKEYTRALYDFIESNKQISEFKKFKYSEIILIDECYLQYLENIIFKMKKQPLALAGPEVINFEEENNILPLPNQLFEGVIQNIIVNYQHKKLHQVAPPDHALMMEFYEYSNIYSDLFESDLEKSKRQEYNERQDKNPNTDLETPLFPLKDLTASKRQEFEEIMAANKFDVGLWNQWANVYSS